MDANETSPRLVSSPPQPLFPLSHPSILPSCRSSPSLKPPISWPLLPIQLAGLSSLLPRITRKLNLALCTPEWRFEYRQLHPPTRTHIIHLMFYASWSHAFFLACRDVSIVLSISTSFLNLQSGLFGGKTIHMKYLERNTIEVGSHVGIIYYIMFRR